mgnify:CR=1 FL=1
MVDAELENTWNLLEKQIESGDYSGNRVYRRLDIEKESGLRLSVKSPGTARELLIQIDENDDFSFSPPEWVGMKFDIAILDVPEKRTSHISLFLEAREHERIFATVCSDIAETLSLIENPSFRTQELQSCLDRWNSFFKKIGPDGLSPERQRGLYGELAWLELLLNNDLYMAAAVESWKGCDRGYHDFEIARRVVEVKTTMTKEPRRVRINNERQLDDRGLESLHLYVLTLQKFESGGETLPDLVEKIRERLKDNVSAIAQFEKSLKKAGYLDIHAHNYTSGYVRKKQETFQINDKFPRIIELPDGVGGLSYSITISACTNFRFDIDSAVTDFSHGVIK